MGQSPVCLTFLLPIPVPRLAKIRPVPFNRPVVAFVVVVVVL